ncbi:MAG: ABC transporter permease [Candidatus Neomarinimicrobiota bacterium]|nr:ABC transporter permease [Candidatus Neomarinimicrobiota bacterium]MDX9779465.1 ABC transporter permease [bacterium]
MNKTFSIIQWELKRGLRSKAFLVSMLMPFVVLLIAIVPTFMAMNADIDEKNLGIIDQNDGLYEKLETHFSTAFLNKNGEPVYRIQAYSSTPDNHDTLVHTLIRDGFVDVLLLIRPDFARDARIEIYHRQDVGIEEISRLEQSLQKFSMEERILSLGLTKADLDYLLKKPRITMYEIGKGGDASRSNLIARYGVPGIFLWLLVMGVVMSSSMLISGVIEERSNRIIEILMSAVKPRQLMTGKIIGIGMLGVFQILLYLFIILLFTLLGGSALNLDLHVADVFTPAMIWYFLYFILGYFMYASLYVGLGSLFDNERDAQQSVGYLSLFAVLPIMLIQPIMMNPQTPLATILAFIPLTTPFMMILKIGMLSAPFWEILGMMLYQIFWMLLIIWAGSKLFRTRILMYGKRATLKEVLQWLRK